MRLQSTFPLLFDRRKNFPNLYNPTTIFGNLIAINLKLMEHVIITGTSGGIGKALAMHFLSRGHAVTGIGRNHVIVHPQYTGINCDLSDASQVQELQLTITSDILLINNAGTIGDIRRMSDQDQTDIGMVMQVNLVAPAILMQRCAVLCGDRFRLTVVNISSGASKRAIPSWAAYCTSKAGLEMLSEVFYQEESEKGRATKVYAVSPGVVDTAMQQSIRNTSPENFSALGTFQQYFETGELAAPEIVARKLQFLLDSPWNGQVSVSLRDVQLSTTD